ncbi:hypothetical protein ACFLWO_00650 [Chloroflexota bacterium]
MQLFSIFEAKYRKIYDGFETRGIAGMIKRLFGRKSKLSPHQRFPSAYFKSVYISKDVYSGIELVASIEKTSVKQATDMLIKVGISCYVAILMKQHGINEMAKGGFNQNSWRNFVRELIKYAEEQGIDISKII